MARLKRNDSSRCGCVCSIAPSDVIEGANFGSHIAGPSSRSKDTAGHIKRTAGEGSHAFDSFPLPSSSQTSTNSFPAPACARGGRVARVGRAVAPLRAVAPARWPGPLRLAPGARPYHGPIMGESARPPRPPAATPSCCQKNFVVKVFINHPPPLNSERFQLKCDTPETKELPGRGGGGERGDFIEIQQVTESR